MAARVFILLVLTAIFACAGTINIGYVALESNNPIDGLKTFSFYNLTGPDFGCTVDFPVCNEITLTGTLAVLLDSPNGPVPVNIFLDPFGPGSVSPVGSTFDASVVILSAIFSGSLTPIEVQLVGGGSRTIVGGVQSGNVMSTNDAFALITATFRDENPIPEPGTFGLLGAGFLLLVARRRGFLNS